MSNFIYFYTKFLRFLIQVSSLDLISFLSPSTIPSSHWTPSSAYWTSSSPHRTWTSSPTKTSRTWTSSKSSRTGTSTHTRPLQITSSRSQFFNLFQPSRHAITISRRQTRRSISISFFHKVTSRITVTSRSTSTTITLHSASSRAGWAEGSTSSSIAVGR